MPHRSSLNGVILFIGIGALLLVANHTEEAGPMRAPASVSKRDFMTHEPLALRHTHKIRGPLESSIELIGGLPEKAGDVFVLKGLVISSRDLRDVDFEWAIPAGLELVNGSVKGQISIVKAGLPVDLQITLKSLNGENHRVHLVTNGNEQGIRFADSSQFNTLLQPMINESRVQLKKLSEKSMAEDAAARRGVKIFH